jgi:CxxC motif-containing protein (DUF1111 family)
MDSAMNVKATLAGLLSLACAGSAAGCHAAAEGSEGGESGEVASVTAALTNPYDAPLPGLTAAQVALFNEGREAFEEAEDAADGLGPVFNANACAVCHTQGAIGGASEQFVTRFGKKNADGSFDPLAQFGGSLIQSQGLGQTAPGCFFAAEQVPAAANVSTHRLTTPLFGLGLVDAVPDATFQSMAATQKKYFPHTAGRAHLVDNPPLGKQTVGKFGWKAQVPSLLVFAADAYLNEMGITTSIFPHDNCPDGDCALLAACDPVPDAAGPEDAGDVDMLKFRDFMAFHAAPPRGPQSGETFDGEDLFYWIGCTDCHTPSLTTGANAVAALNKKTFFPYSDFLLHDMGTLGDGIEQNGAKSTEIRTAPLWGAAVRTRFLHDGRATSVEAAILAHTGQGKEARDLFANYLFDDERKAVIAFIKSL